VQPRHDEVTRIEEFSDAVFGFALTLLVVKLEAPKNDADRTGVVLIFGIFGLAIAMASQEGPRIMLAGLVYSFMGPLHAWNGMRHGRARRKVVAA
jgi:hypothetical protein